MLAQLDPSTPTNAHPQMFIAQSVLRLRDLPLIAASANISGQPTCRTGIQVFDTTDGRVHPALDGGT